MLISDNNAWYYLIFKRCSLKHLQSGLFEGEKLFVLVVLLVFYSFERKNNGNCGLTHNKKEQVCSLWFLQSFIQRYFGNLKKKSFVIERRVFEIMKNFFWFDILNLLMRIFEMSILDFFLPFECEHLTFWKVLRKIYMSTHFMKILSFSQWGVFNVFNADCIKIRWQLFKKRFLTFHFQ